MSPNLRSKAASKPADAAEHWPDRSHLSSFVRCLHLLDLDLLEDWPGITVQTLSTRSATQNLQQRVKAVEWSLFRLFELYDAQLTRDKLRPFFPPQSHLQSQNLRAALLRVLTDLKRTGVLERDAVLRKTTFDECKGDKFEELLSGFAGIVLREQQRGRAARALPPTGSEVNRLPLLLAHRVILRARLEHRENLKAKVLDHERELSERGEQLSRIRKELRKHQPPDKHVHADAEASLRDSWTADPAWVNALLRDFPASSGFLERNRPGTSEDDDEPMLQKLGSLITARETQLNRWAAFKSSLPTNDVDSAQPRSQESRARPLFSFGKHKDLHMNSFTTDTLQTDMETNTIQKRYEDLLSGLSQALSSVASSKSIHGLGGDGAAEPNPDPVRPSSVSCRLATQGSKVLAAELIIPPSEQREVKLDGQSLAVETSMMRDQTSTQSLPDDETFSPDVSLTVTSPIPTDEPAEQPLNLEELDLSEGVGNSLPPETPSPQRGYSLQERTRMSMAGAFRNVDNHPTSPPHREQKTSSQEHFAASSPENKEDDGSLVARTRKSMSLLTTIADMKANRRVSKGPRVSQLYPVDPFETPRRSSSRISLQTPGSGGSTPREKLFSDDADITSVFKSRPKIALSPMISPSRSTLDEDSVLASQAGNLYLDEDDMDRSP